jgi:Fe-Mn family superoxide dismutase
MIFELPNLSYSTDALEPHFDARTMEIHHGKHHQTYINNLNNALEGDDQLLQLKVDDLISDFSVIPESIQGAVRNQGGGHANHSFFWESLSPEGGGIPKGALNDAIASSFGDFESMKKAFTQAALTRFGSGWAWLIQKSDGSLAVTSTPNQDSPLMEGIAEVTGKPIIGLDVWEHAYYLNYQNRRPDYIAAFWNVVDWEKAGSLFI